MVDAALAQAIQENLSIPCRSDETIREINRGIRFHLTKYIKELGNGNIEQAQLGLGHSYSRTKVSPRFVLFAVAYIEVLVMSNIVNETNAGMINPEKRSPIG